MTSAAPSPVSQHTPPQAAAFRHGRLHRRHRVVAVLCAVVWVKLVSFACGDVLASYSFTTNSAGADGFVAEQQIPGLVAGNLQLSGFGFGGAWNDKIVTSFRGAVDNLNYSPKFDGRGFEIPLESLTTNVSSETRYVRFRLSPLPGNPITVTNVRVDFGFDSLRANLLETSARYGLFWSTNDGLFEPVPPILSSAPGGSYPGYTVIDNLGRTGLPLSFVTNTIEFRLAFAHNGLGSYYNEKFVFIDDIVVEGFVTPSVQLEVEDGIAYEADPDHIAIFKLSRAPTASPLTVHYAITPSNPTNGAATQGNDYTLTSPSPVVFAPGESTKRVVVRPRGGNAMPGALGAVWAEPPESITFNLLPDPSYVGSPTSAVAILYDDDLPEAVACFSDDFNTAASAANWEVVSNGTPNTVTFGYDYSGDVPSPPPGGTDMLGLKVAFPSAPTSNAVVNLFHRLTECCSTRYSLEFDLYLSYNAGVSSSAYFWHAMAGINGDTGAVNSVWFSPFAQQSGISGAGQFVTVSATESPSSTYGGAHLWAPPVSGAVVSFPPTAAKIGELLNNPPYGAVGGAGGIFGCDSSSPNKGWLRCQLFRLDDVVRFQVNGYPILEAVVGGMPACPGAVAPALADGAGLLSTASLGVPTADTLWIGAGTGSTLALNQTEHFAIFDNFEGIVWATNAALTGIGVDYTNVYLHFYSEASTNALDYPVFSSTNSTFIDISTDVRREQIHPEDVRGSEGYFGGWLLNGFLEEGERFILQVPE